MNDIIKSLDLQKKVLMTKVSKLKNEPVLSHKKTLNFIWVYSPVSQPDFPIDIIPKLYFLLRNISLKL